MPDWELLLEAERRGILPADKAELLSEARSRGLVPGQSAASPEALATGAGVRASLSDVPMGIVSGIGRGLAGMISQPVSEIAQAVRNIGRAGEIEPGVFTRDPTALWQAAKGTAADIGRNIAAAGRMAWQAGPEIAGGIAGGALTGTPQGAAAGGALARGATSAINQAIAGRPDTPQALTEMGTSLGLGLIPPAAVQGAGRAVYGLGTLPIRPDVAQAFARQGGQPTAATLSGSARASTAENLLSRTFGGGPRVQAAQEAEMGSIGRGLQESTPQAFRAGAYTTGQTAKEAVAAELEALKGEAGRLKAHVVQEAGPGPMIPAKLLTDKARQLANQLEQVRPGLRDDAAIANLRAFATKEAPGPPAKRATGFETAGGQEITQTTPTKRDLSYMTFGEWDATMQALGRMIRESHPIAEKPLQQQAKALYREGIKAMDQAIAQETTTPSAAAALRIFKDFYKDKMAGFNESFPGRLVSGDIYPEDITRLMSKTNVTELKDLWKYAPKSFPQVRDVAFGKMLQDAGIVTEPSRFGKWWKKLDPDVKSAAFADQPALIRQLDDLATMAEATAFKYGASGGNPSATALSGAQMGQVGGIAGSMGAAGALAAQGRPAAAAVSVGAAVLNLLGPYGAARLLTSPGGIRYLTQAYQVPAQSAQGAAMLGLLQAGRDGERSRQEFGMPLSP